MKAENAIEVHNITKEFKVYYDKGHTLKEMTLFSKRRRFEERKVLNGISFEVKKGEAIGLIGHNGCGKSTTLKLLTRIMYPDSGNIEMRGRVSSLIELGAGFHPDMSGRQNIYTNAAIFGLTRKEIAARIDHIITFSELGEYIDNPVRTYSSGMYMRLAFAVAINVNADILLIDEILAVGDANFQAKCFDKLKQIKTEGTTIVIVSHSLGQIEEICERSIWIQGGKIEAEGSPRDIHPLYLEYMGQKRQNIKAKEQAEEDAEKKSTEAKESKTVEQKTEDQHICLNDIKLIDKDGQEKQILKTGDLAILKVSYQAKQTVKDAVIGIAIYREDGIKCYETHTGIDQLREITLSECGTIQFTMNPLQLLPGRYSLDIKISMQNGLIAGFYKKALEFEMYSEVRDGGISRIEHQWDIQ
ncbi:MAG: ABC transporter ATP-binding protein [Lachnospiraceae bacterium]